MRKENAPSKARPRAADQVYNMLKEDILSGEIVSGDLLSENELARRFQVSRTPVREALNQLACDGLLKVLPKRGHLVRTVSFSEVMEAFRMRELLEVEAAGEAARCITDEELEMLRNIMTDPKDTVMANYNFHTAIARISRNRLLAESIEEILMLMQSMMANHPTLLNPNPELKVVDALATRDPEVARKAMREHIYEARDSLMNNFSQQR